MEKLLIDLENWGCDINDAMMRFMNNEALYISFCDEVINDPNYETLINSLKEHKIREAFEAAHSLKGVLGNMGITPMYRVINKIVEPLRLGADVDLSSEIALLNEYRKEFAEIVNKNK